MLRPFPLGVTIALALAAVVIASFSIHADAGIDGDPQYFVERR